MVKFLTVSGNTQLIIVAAILIAAVFLAVWLLGETNRGVVGFGKLVLAAWSDEWYGKERVGKCNRAGTIILFTFVGMVFLVRETHSLIRGEKETMSPVIWLFGVSVAFLLLSLYALVRLEERKMVLNHDRFLRRFQQGIPGRNR